MLLHVWARACICSEIECEEAERRAREAREAEQAAAPAAAIPDQPQRKSRWATTPVGHANTPQKPAKKPKDADPAPQKRLRALGKR
jgi:hypothetical protein